ncbi:MAG TPA: cobalamin-independent methionine synthase II family protein [Stellaceae bacterium]|jgi:5-methyltetrahydropteroyltriglutamate--homocysteine methyltransferase
MKRSSTAKILATHVGALPEPAPLDRKAPDFDAKLKGAVAWVVKKQRECGIDVINEGEYTKGGDWLSYVENRFGGFSQRPPASAPLIAQGKDREDFPDFYRYATERGTLFYMPARPGNSMARPTWVCTGPVTYLAKAEVEKELALLKSLVPAEDAFLTATAPASLEVYRRNEYYKTDEEYVFAIAEAMRVEYETIAKSGVILQVDDAWLPALWDRIGIKMGLEAFRKRCEVRVEALNHALANVAEEQVRYHLCWGSWHGPHVHDLEMKHLVDIMLKVKAQAYLFEAANARHEHEYAVWETVKLPAGKIVIPGVVTHSTDVVEHPELVSQRIQRFANLVGKENVMAGTDCGFGWRSHPEIAWAKMKALGEGAALATKALKYA